MKKAAGLTLLMFLMCLLFPAWLMAGRDDDKPDGTEPCSTSAEAPPVITEPSVTGQRDSETELVVLHSDGQCQTMDLETYLTGVLLGEMPMDFPLEARKAQAVVCRTYTLRRLGSGKHGAADICTDSACCQAWRDPAICGQEQLFPARQAVQLTAGQVLTYEGELIDATFFSCSGGRTEAAVAVWGTDIPYLQSVESPDENAPYDQDTVIFTEQELKHLLQGYAPTIHLEGSGNQWFSLPTYTAGGSVDTISIGGVVFTGKELRTLLGLRSTAFTVKAENGTVTFTTRGYGHRVGMSQYGARAMALQGGDYRDILSHYYTDTCIEIYLDD